MFQTRNIKGLNENASDRHDMSYFADYVLPFTCVLAKIDVIALHVAQAIAMYLPCQCGSKQFVHFYTL